LKPCNAENTLHNSSAFQAPFAKETNHGSSMAGDFGTAMSALLCQKAASAITTSALTATEEDLPIKVCKVTFFLCKPACKT